MQAYQAKKQNKAPMCPIITLVIRNVIPCRHVIAPGGCPVDNMLHPLVYREKQRSILAAKPVSIH